MQIELKNWSLDMIKNLAKIANNHKITDNVRDLFPHPYTEVDAEKFINFTLEDNEEKCFNRAILVDGDLAGGICLVFETDIYRKSAELGYWLAESYWGKGITSVAVAQICRIGFEKFDLVRIFATPFAGNIGSQRVLEKNGFDKEGVLKKSVFKNGKILDSIMYAKLK